jgi:hypothetical protein
LDVDETDENTLACDMDNVRGLIDEPVTSEVHCIPTGAVQPRVEVVDNQCQERGESIGRWEADASIDNSSSDSEPESSCKESEIIPPQQG